MIKNITSCGLTSSKPVERGVWSKVVKKINWRELIDIFKNKFYNIYFIILNQILKYQHP